MHGPWLMSAFSLSGTFDLGPVFSVQSAIILTCLPVNIRGVSLLYLSRGEIPLMRYSIFPFALLYKVFVPGGAPGDAHPYQHPMALVLSEL